MKKFLLLALLLTAVSLSAQSSAFSLTGTQCATVAVDEKATVAFQVVGTWAGTIQPSVTIVGQPASNLQVTPAATSTPQSTVTGNGAFIAHVSGYSVFQLCGNTITGTAKIYVNASNFPH